MRRALWSAAVAVAVAISAAPLGAQESAPADPVRGAVEWANLVGSLRADYFSSSRSLDDRDHLFGAGLYLKTSPRLGPRVSAVLDGWVRNSRLFEAEATKARLREGYLDLTLGPLDLRAGRQIIVWGRADRINPTDNLTPRDFTLLVPEDDDQRFGAPAVRATLHVGGLAAGGVWIPVFDPNDIPFPDQPGVTFREVTPATSLRNSQWAAKIEQTGGPLDWSLSYFNGFDLYPDLGIGSVAVGPDGTPALEVLLRHHRLQVIGADASAAVGRFGLRGEVAYALTRDRHGRDPETKAPYLFLVVGADRTFVENLNVNVQYLFRAVTSFRDPEQIEDPLQRTVAVQQAVIANQLDRFQHGASIRVSDKWLNETLEAELAGVYGFTRGDYAIRPKVIYAFTDRLKGTIGGDLFQGSRRSFFGRIRETSTVFAELKYSF